MANDSGGGMMMAMVMIAGIAFVGYFLLKKQDASSSVQQAAATPSQTVVQPQTTIIQTPVAVPFAGPVVFINDDPDFGFPQNPCHFWGGARYDPDDRKCYYPFHQDCDDRGLVFDPDHDSCISPPTRDIDIHRPTQVNITINETATKGGKISNTVNAQGQVTNTVHTTTGSGGTTKVNVNTTPSSTWSFKLQSGKTVDPSTITTFVSNCHSALGGSDPNCTQVRSMCGSGGGATNQDVCTALHDAGFQ